MTDDLYSEPCPHGSTFGTCISAECDDILTDVEEDTERD